MSAAALEPVSPELALVCPELGRRARKHLPERDPDGFLRPLTATSPRTARTWLAALLYAAVSTLQIVTAGVVITTAAVLVLTLGADWWSAGH